ncbi:unnamed protein product, partial [Protopolystoma xenopodis]
MDGLASVNSLQKEETNIPTADDLLVDMKEETQVVSRTSWQLCDPASQTVASVKMEELMLDNLGINEEEGLTQRDESYMRFETNIFPQTDNVDSENPYPVHVVTHTNKLDTDADADIDEANEPWGWSDRQLLEKDEEELKDEIELPHEENDLKDNIVINEDMDQPYTKSINSVVTIPFALPLDERHVGEMGAVGVDPHLTDSAQIVDPSLFAFRAQENTNAAKADTNALIEEFHRVEANMMMVPSEELPSDGQLEEQSEEKAAEEPERWNKAEEVSNTLLDIDRDEEVLHQGTEVWNKITTKDEEIADEISSSCNEREEVAALNTCSDVDIQISRYDACEWKENENEKLEIVEAASVLTAWSEADEEAKTMCQVEKFKPEEGKDEVEVSETERQYYETEKGLDGQMLALYGQTDLELSNGAEKMFEETQPKVDKYEDNNKANKILENDKQINLATE